MTPPLSPPIADATRHLQKSLTEAYANAFFAGYLLPTAWLRIQIGFEHTPVGVRIITLSRHPISGAPQLLSHTLDLNGRTEALAEVYSDMISRGDFLEAIRTATTGAIGCDYDEVENRANHLLDSWRDARQAETRRWYRSAVGSGQPAAAAS